jgi:nucleotide-binding universal stress UspA family protein
MLSSAPDQLPALASLPTSRKNLQLQTILVPVDFSAASLRALDYAVLLAAQFPSAVHLLYVHDGVDEFSPAASAARLLFEAAESRMRLRLAGMREEHGSTLRPEDCHVEFGHADRKTCDLARRLEADLIVIASRGRTGWQRILLGSTAERIARHAPCPVLVVRQKEFLREAALGLVRRILVPVDFSDLSIKAVEYAAALAAPLGARLHLLHVAASRSPGFIDRDVRDPEAIRCAEMANAREQLSTIARMERLSSVPCETEVQSGNAIEEICGAIGRTGADLIVTATHGVSGLKQVLLGSVAEHMLRYAGCPVLVLSRDSMVMK